MAIDLAALKALLPLIVLAASAVAVMLLAAFSRGAAVASATTLAGLLLAFVAVAAAIPSAPRQVSALLTVDRYALFYWALMIASAFAVAALCHDGFGVDAGRDGALHALLLLATLGAATLAASSHFAAFFLGLEVLSVSLFALIAYPVDARRALEAAIKYLILSGGSSAFLLFGMALVYARAGTMEFGQIGVALAGRPLDAWGSAGLGLIVVGIGFKLAVVPFHMWIADVYEGASPPVAAFVATVSKGAVVALLMRYFVATGAYRSTMVTLALTLVAVASILAGNLLALLQDNVKRILGYSSVAHLGYLLVAFLAAGALAGEAVAYYLTAYFVTMIAAFGAIGLLAHSGPAETIADYRALFWRRPWTAAVFAAALLSLAGIPLTMGFIAKFYVVAVGAGAGLWVPLFALVIGSTIGLFYYLRIIAAMAATQNVRALPGAAVASLAAGGTLAVLTLLQVWLGIYSAPLLRLLEATVARLH
ncbi:MAG TPA: NADH-quinone oxidoreductase subunit N [Ramlibacter sp.]|nr:NADH-quinone oxidoreductase subunit N [Ramlibacter sp.]